MDYRELNSVWILKREYERESRRLEDLREFAKPSTPIFDGMPQPASPPLSSKVETVATLVIETEKTLVRLAVEIEAQKKHLLSMLQSVGMKEVWEFVLKHHYVGCKSFNAIAKLMNFSRRYILDLHEAGLKALGLDVQQMIQFRKRLEVHA